MSRMKKMKIPDGLDADDYASMLIARGCEVKIKIDTKTQRAGVWVGTCTVKPKVPEQ